MEKAEGVVLDTGWGGGCLEGRGRRKDSEAAGAVSYRGAIYFNTATPKFARLNAVATVFEFEVDAEGNTHSKLWEWK